MQTETDELFGPDEPVAEAPPVVVEQQPEVEQVTPEAEPEAPAPVEAEPPQPTPAAPPNGFVPVDALQEERRRRQALERELEQSRQAPAPVDPLDDPEGFARQLEGRVSQEVSALRFQFSEQTAVSQYGREAVDKAAEWAIGRANADPQFAASYFGDPDPIGFIVRQHQQTERLQQLESDPVAFARLILEQHNALPPVPTQPAIAPAAAQAPAPPKSLVSAPSSGAASEVALGDAASFDAVFRE